MILDTKEPCTAEHIHLTPEEEERHVEVHAYPIINARNEVTHIMEYLRDVTDSRLREREMLETQLRRKKEMQRAKEETEKASLMRSQFMANMSHEIRTPLNIIIGFTDLLLEEELDKSRMQKLSNIREAGGNLLCIINDVLDFSRLESSLVQLEETPFSILTLFSELKDMFEPQAAEKGIDLRVRCGESMPRKVKGDEERVRQIFMNLLSNAVKFTSEGCVELSCSYRRGRIEARVADSGIGIAEDRCRDIFSPFQQLDGSTSRKYGGTGLGLAITKILTESMGGSIDVYSSPGEGTSFDLSIPLPPGEWEPEPKPGAGGEGPAAPARGHGEEIQACGHGEEAPAARLRICIAEDNHINQKLVKMLLEKMGHSCSVASDGNQVMELLREGPFDVLLLDIHMPRKDGFDVIEEIRGDERLRDLHVIALTASAMKGDAEKLIAAGCDDYLAKPVHRQALQQRLENVREFRKTRSE